VRRDVLERRGAHVGVARELAVDDLERRKVSAGEDLLDVACRKRPSPASRMRRVASSRCSREMVVVVTRLPYWPAAWRANAPQPVRISST